jgi:predicted RNA binding protein YcfA (HicA-like mRNA interferase family)
MKSRDLLRALQADGWSVVRVRGSHHQLKHPVKPGLLTVPHPKKNLGGGLVSAILKQAGLARWERREISDTD